MHPGITATELCLVFDRQIQGSLGVVAELSVIQRIYHDYHRRFKVHAHDIIPTASGDCVVCNQWSRHNIGPFIRRARELGFEIEPVQ